MFAQQPRHRERREARHERFALPEDVAPALDRADGRRIGRRTPDADPLELFDEGGFGVSRRRTRLVSLRLEPDQPDARLLSVDTLADRQRGQERLLLFELGGRIVAALDVGAAEAGELDRPAGRREHRLFTVAGRGRDLDRRAEDAGVDHLRRHRALPDELVDLQIVARQDVFERRGRAAEIRRPDGLVRFLRVLHLRRVAARRGVVVGAEQLADGSRRLRQRLVAERRRIGAVIRDVAFLEQTLRGLHGPLRRETQLTARLLRERRGGERGRGPLDARLRLDVRHGPR